MISIQMTCPNCKGSGTIIRDFCNNCRGSGYVKEKVNENINIPKGVDTGHTLRIANRGHRS